MNDHEHRSSREELSRARDRGVALVLSLVVAAAIDTSDRDPDSNGARSDGDGNVLPPCAAYAGRESAELAFAPYSFARPWLGLTRRATLVDPREADGNDAAR